MATQLPAIVRFITNSGDWGVINSMKQAGSVTQAAWEWGRGVERFGIPDVHSAGISLATQIMNATGAAVSAGGGAPANAQAIAGAASKRKHLANGGTISERVWGIGESGTRYSFGESGSERVIPENKLAGEHARTDKIIAQNAQIIALLERQNMIAQAGYRDTANALGGIGKRII